MLWQKPLSAVAFSDVDAFLKAKLPEGYRLDYKLTFPTDLAKTIAAFANTLGGLILLGVDGDKVSNEPIWPPIKGMPDDPGIADRIIQIATEAIYPPVRVSVAQMPNILLPSHQIAVVRIDESRDAPHAVEKKRKVFVYERTDNKNDPHVLAEIDRIKYLFDRRQAVELQRERLIEQGVAKLRAELKEALKPQCWVAVAPVFPWRNICRPSQCYDTLKEIAGGIGHPRTTHATVQRIPNGAFMRIKSCFNVVHANIKLTDASTIHADGTFIYMRTILSLDRRHEWGVELLDYEQADKYFQIANFWPRIAEIFKFARSLYGRDGVERPGMLSLQFGLEGMLGYRLLDRERQSNPYTEDIYQDNDFVDVDSFMDSDACFEGLGDRFLFGFDVETPEGM